MVKIRLARHGKKNNPFYRVVAIDSTKKVGGEALATLGFWHPQKGTLKIDKKAVAEWEKKGALVSDAVVKLLSK
ncbi:30S ribosomal protein S16 [Candidatus Woesebacteria bacterium RIFCSPHIGHO2_01_FULL_44_21]|uniref:Small ribosomal subunit protein bS16 n=1 Tax=Candidatus Woesebacteria bacterium RIFCSPHIGHO2_01_FULL_44_21 TaxID=1802503 RepID=A0A1F7Z0C8_9BACT|nr:MAG: 30S ribosomal protein S16 [Candidatus Woesebacteria bacterium RIFCSPHIGHO2_01_FULL_44_21]OGM69201.1 MAG: 30S ribosomal protein S16 [Candidatus Woesebacteria bacterium RIFCSPLOWO2_01_FULL_44_24b]